MTYLSLLYAKGSELAGSLTRVGGLLLIGGAARAGMCPTATPVLETLIQAETSFANAAATSVRQAFLANLADDALVLQPDPVPARRWYESHPEGTGTLQWYPHVADVAASGDLGFTSGPYVSAHDAAQSFGQYLTVWRMSPDCRWQIAFDGGISHARPPAEAAAVDPSSVAPVSAPTRPPEDVVAAFQTVAAREGLGAALRTYARNDGFLLLLEGRPPMDLDHAQRQLRTRIVKEVWREAAHGASGDATLTYGVGSLGAGAFAQIWQYDARTASRCLRVLLLTSP